MSNKIVSVIVVSCGAKNYLELCLDSLRGQTHCDLEIIVIDNSLDPNFGQKITEHYPEIKFYAQTRNLCYCAALNLGIRQSRGEFILCLNDDVVLESGFVKDALQGFFIEPKIGIVSGKILRSDRKTLDSTGLFLTPWRTAKERGYGSEDKGKFEREGYIFGVNGAVAFYRKEMLEEIKEGCVYFDSDFHIFYEDLDIAWRASRFGWKGYYIPTAIAYHVRGGTIRTSCGIGKPYARRYISDELQMDLVKNRYLTIIKNESCFDFFLHLPCIIFYDFFIWGYILFFKPHLIKNFILNLKYINSTFKKRISPSRD